MQQTCVRTAAAALICAQRPASIKRVIHLSGPVTPTPHLFLLPVRLTAGCTSWSEPAATQRLYHPTLSHNLTYADTTEQNISLINENHKQKYCISSFQRSLLIVVPQRSYTSIFLLFLKGLFNKQYFKPKYSRKPISYLKL